MMRWRSAYVPRQVLQSRIVLPNWNIEHTFVDPNPCPIDNSARFMPFFLSRMFTGEWGHLTTRWGVSRNDRIPIDIAASFLTSLETPTQTFSMQRASPHDLLGVLILGERLIEFAGCTLIELPTRTRANEALEFLLSLDQEQSEPGTCYSIGLICFRLRTFLVRKVSNGHPPVHHQMITPVILQEGQPVVVPVPPIFYDASIPAQMFFEHTLNRIRAQEARSEGQRNKMCQEIEHYSKQPHWKGTLIFGGSRKSYKMKACAFRALVPEKRCLLHLSDYPEEITLQTTRRIHTKNLIENISSPYGEWLGILLPSNEDGVAAQTDTFVSILTGMQTKKFGYAAEITRAGVMGTMYIWTMEAKQKLLVFSFVADPVSRLAPLNALKTWHDIPGPLRWEGRLCIMGSLPLTWRVRAFDWPVGGMCLREGFFLPDVVVVTTDRVSSVTEVADLVHGPYARGPVRFYLATEDETGGSPALFEELLTTMDRENLAYLLKTNSQEEHNVSMVLMTRNLGERGIILLGIGHLFAELRLTNEVHVH